MLWLDGDTWRPVSGASAYAVDRDRYNTVTFDAVEAQVLRVEAKLRPNFSGGILEVKFD